MQGPLPTNHVAPKKTKKQLKQEEEFRKKQVAAMQKAAANAKKAEDDAAKMAHVLEDLGNVAAGDLYLLQGRSRALLDAAFQRAKDRIAERHRLPGERALLLFYFSGHSDGESIELGADRLPFADLRQRLLDTGADIRVVIVDSCRSGALLASKGGRAGPAFDIRMRDDLPTSGQVLLTSSAADEEALESREIHGSYFTHHLVSGMRGAADAAGRGQVTLGEAYRYAYDHTVAATSQVLVGPQHPGYDYRLSGMGELVLTELSRPASVLVLPTGFTRALVAEPWRDEVLAEVPAGAARRLSVPPGDYVVRLWRGSDRLEGRITVVADQPRVVAWNELAPIAALPPGLAKGSAGSDPGWLSSPVPTPTSPALDNDVPGPPQVAAQPQRSVASRVLPFALIGVGAIAAGVAVYGGAQVLSYQSIASSGPHQYTSAQAQAAYNSASFWRYGWVGFAAAAAAAGVGAAFTW